MQKYETTLSMASYVGNDGLFPDYVVVHAPEGTEKEGCCECYFPVSECSMWSTGFVDAYEVFECSRCGERMLMGRPPKFCPSCGARVV